MVDQLHPEYMMDHSVEGSDWLQYIFIYKCIDDILSFEQHIQLRLVYSNWFDTSAYADCEVGR